MLTGKFRKSRDNQDVMKIMIHMCKQHMFEK